jgi:hypothetical protein
VAAAPAASSGGPTLDDPTVAPGPPTVGGATPDPASDTTAPAGPVTSATPVQPDQRPYPTAAVDLAAELSEAELALRQPGIDQRSAAPWGRRQQILYRVLAANPDWAATVLDATDPSVAGAVRANWLARQEALALVNTEDLSPTLPAWRIQTPLPADELLGYYREAEAATGVPWTVLAAVNLVETRMGRIHGVSTAGAVGPMQFLPSTWSSCCQGDPTVDRDAIVGAAVYLTDRGAPANIDRALFGYNNSDDYVRTVNAYASVMAADEQAYYGYHAWDVLFLSAAGLVRLAEGYDQAEPVDAATWLRDHPEALIPPETG